MKRNWLWLAGPWALFIVLAIAWVTYWHVAAGEAERRIQSFLTEQQSRGASASIGRIARHGFPVMLRLELRDVNYGPARGGWQMTTERADLHLNLLNPQHITLEAEAPIAFQRAGGAVTNVTADALIATLRTNNGRLVTAGVEADNLALDDPEEEGILRAAKVVLNVRPDPRAAGEYQIAFDTQALTLPRPVRSFEGLGQDVQALRAAIVVEQGAALLETSPGDPLAPWREAEGKLRFDALVLNWGALQTTGAGEGGLDDQRRLQGALRLPVDRPGPVFAAIANGPDVDEDARSGLSLLATAYMLSGDDINLDVEANNGVLRLEGITVRTLPPVYGD